MLGIDTSTTRMPAASRSPFFYGWVILALGCIGTSVAYGVRGSFSVFYVAILKDFGWGRAETALIFSTGIVVYGLTAPFSGALIDRLGPRRVMPLGCSIVALGAVACSQAREIWQFYLFYGLLSMGVCLTAFVPYTAILSRWFVRRRATAFGILSAGSNTSFGFLLVSEALIAAFGWRNAYIWLAALVALVLLPLEALFVRRSPAEVGQHPDGISPQPAASPAPVRVVVGSRSSGGWASADWTVGKALRTYRFWALFLANMCLWGLGQNLLVAHQVAYAVDLGFTAALGATMTLVFGMSSMVGAVTGGLISDRIGRERGFTAGCGVAFLGVGILASTSANPSAWLLFAYAVVMGCGLGFASPSLTSSIADLFAGRNFGSINGAMVAGFGLGGSLGPFIGGLIYDQTAGYLPAFYFVMAMIVVAVVFLWVAGPRQVRSARH